MATFKVETKNKVDIDKKPRVYFTCHPDDFEKHFKKVCDDIFKTHDCAIYYTEDMTEVIAEDEKQVDLGRNNLFVVPVTFKLLSTPNRAMDEDIPYALKEHIPVLPIMMEPGIDEFYSKPDKFGELQYLNPYSTDITEISYDEKLKKYLESVLISDEMAKRVRAAFDAYIFLSYRKKDRKYANELMRLIHRYPECRDIAIWFDEFLTPGESFRDSIDKILSDSKLFALLVTPNLLEEPDGKPNFVMSEEYPAAQKSGIEILPTEMEDTDKITLEGKFKGIPTCVDPHQDEAFKARLLETITKLAIKSNNTPEHNFLIGLAYLEGIDVEVNRERALKLIISAAEDGLVMAITKLVCLYRDKTIAVQDVSKATKWQEQLALIRKKVYLDNKTSSNLIQWLDSLLLLGDCYTDICLIDKAIECFEMVIEESQKGSEMISESKSFLYYIAEGHLKLGSLKNDPSESQRHYLLCYEKAIAYESIFNEIRAKRLLICVCTAIGEQTQDYYEARDWYLKVENTAEELLLRDSSEEGKLRVAQLYANLGDTFENGEIYYNRGRQTALKYYDNCVRLLLELIAEFDSLQAKNLLLTVYISLAWIYKDEYTIYRGSGKRNIEGLMLEEDCKEKVIRYYNQALCQLDKMNLSLKSNYEKYCRIKKELLAFENS
ncbi:MAG: toll/interleukin-1 receptor domain-containing protein [Clostridia bacterium]|nr:toll/interleukin-1 receptor domain-containing protein [Clostridia bacterium]